MVTIPPIISVDDHVIEPPHLWQEWLPAKFRERGPRVVRAPYEMLAKPSGGWPFAPGGRRSPYRLVGVRRPSLRGGRRYGVGRQGAGGDR